MAVPQKNQRITILSNNSISRHPKEVKTETQSHETHLYTMVETTQVSLNRRRDNQNVVYTIGYSLKEEENSDTY